MSFFYQIVIHQIIYKKKFIKEYIQEKKSIEKLNQ